MVDTKNQIVLNETKNLLKEGICINMLNEYIQFQLNLETRENSDKKSIETTVKAAFDVMLNNGDVSITVWEYLKKTLASSSLQRIKDVKFKREKNYMLDLIESINKTNTFNGNTVSTISEMGMEDISGLNIKLDDEIFNTMMLIETASKLIDQANKNLIRHKDSIKEMSKEIVNKYNKLFPVSFVENIKESL